MVADRKIKIVLDNVTPVWQTGCMSKKQTITTPAGVRRERHFANGGTLHEWRGGLAVRIPNKKREANRKACRKFTME